MARVVSRISQSRTNRDAQGEPASQYARSLIEASLDALVTISPEGNVTDVLYNASVYRDTNGKVLVQVQIAVIPFVGNLSGAVQGVVASHPLPRQKSWIAR